MVLLLQSTTLTGGENNSSLLQKRAYLGALAKMMHRDLKFQMSLQVTHYTVVRTDAMLSTKSSETTPFLM